MAEAMPANVLERSLGVRAARGAREMHAEEAHKGEEVAPLLVREACGPRVRNGVENAPSGWPPLANGEHADMWVLHLASAIFFGGGAAQSLPNS